MINNRRRLLLKAPMLFVVGAVLSTKSNNAHADPIKLIIDAMAYAAKFVLDVAIQMTKDMMQEVMNGAYSNDTKKVAAIGDGLNTFRIEMANAQIARDSAPGANGCTISEKLKAVHEQKRRVETDPTNTSTFVKDVVSGNNWLYGKDIREALRDGGLSTQSIGSNSRAMRFSIPHIMRDFGKMRDQEDVKRHKEVMQVVNGEGGVYREMPEADSLPDIRRRMIYSQQLLHCATANHVFSEDLNASRSEVIGSLKGIVDETYYSETWRSQTAAVASEVPNLINLINQKATTLEMLLFYLGELERTQILKSCMIARALKVD
ncbi:hypothetical protein [Shewanella colwelliana]|uniref:hypothetical protein n=1 Tax=Shewanella colwelliana TaxID=23 RepID=UPI0022AF8D49|nr:hypothetical protein [Shewanella colwelliana]MCZ4337790.1 hypothetical protein [Shewanella colwelliana]